MLKADLVRVKHITGYYYLFVGDSIDCRNKR